MTKPPRAVPELFVIWSSITLPAIPVGAVPIARSPPAPDAQTDATLSLRYGDDRYHFPTNGAGVPGDHNQFNYGSGPTLGLEIGHRFNPRFETRLLLAASETEGGLDNRPDSTADSNLFRSLDNLRRAGRDPPPHRYPPARPVVTAGAALGQGSEHSVN